jgi:retron-type reverse transcriptase
MNPMQFGFRANHSTDTADCLLLENVKSMIDKGGTVGAVFLDLRKAFDPVNHRVLIAKLSSFNFSNNALKWSETYFKNRNQCVNVHNQKSTALDTPTGVPQGSVLSPILFSLYINDLPSVCSDVEIQLYADDAVIYTHGSNKLQAAAKLTNALNRISTWLIQSSLQLNASKTISMFFSKKKF